jgi:ribosomal protein S18 acetylase RimI-like enzyme
VLIRKATLEDTTAVGLLLLSAMEDIVYRFIDRKDHDLALDFLTSFVKMTNNQYSYQNCWVAELDGEVVAAINVYDGAKLDQLRKPVIQYVRTHYNPGFDPEDETEGGEYYIDTFAVDPRYRGKGIGTKLLQHLITEYVTKSNKTLGLLVDIDNPDAKKLYTKLGFESVGTKRLMEKTLTHMQIANATNLLVQKA